MNAGDQNPIPDASALPVRRTVLVLAAAGLLGSTIRWWRLAKDHARPIEPWTALLAPLRAKSAAVIGAVVMSAEPEMMSEDKLVARLLADLGLTRQSAVTASHLDLTRRISETVRRDFETGRIVNVFGWRLAMTEARLCALAAQHAN